MPRTFGSVLLVVATVALVLAGIGMWHVVSLQERIDRLQAEVNLRWGDVTRFGQLETRLGTAEADISALETSALSPTNVRVEIRQALRRGGLVVPASSIEIPFFCFGEVAYWTYFRGLDCSGNVTGPPIGDRR